MSWACLNIDPGLPLHPKIVELEAKIGDAALAYVLRLWCWAAADCPDGRLNMYTNTNFLERRIMRWEGESGVLLRAMAEAQLVDIVGNEIVLHNFGPRNPHLVEYRKRQQAAANARWQKHRIRKQGGKNGSSEV